MATSVPLWALSVTFFTVSWGYYSTLTILPTYMKKIQKYNIQSVSLPVIKNKRLSVNYDSDGIWFKKAA